MKIVNLLLNLVIINQKKKNKQKGSLKAKSKYKGSTR